MTSYKLTGWLYLLGFKSLLSVLDRETHTHTLSILRYDISACSKKKSWYGKSEFSISDADWWH